MTSPTLKFVQKHLVLASTSLLLGVLVFGLSLFGIGLPPNEELPSWIQRSGAIMCISGLLATTLLQRIEYNLEMAFSSSDAIKAQQLKTCRNWIFNIAIIVSIIGTLIWGYYGAWCA